MISNSQGDPKLLAETLAEQYATAYLQNNFGDELFIGSTIEALIQDSATINYQNVDDPDYYGVAIFINDIPQIVVNTHQCLRTRYYSVAHELWHVLVVSGKVKEARIYNIDKERAADHFAAALMLPAVLIHRYWNVVKSLKALNSEAFIFRLADLSAMPYVAVERRVRELELTKLPKDWKSRTEDNWIQRRAELGLIASPMDSAKTHVGFSDLSKLVSENLDAKKITTDEAISILTYADPNKAKTLQRERLEQITAAANADDD